MGYNKGENQLVFNMNPFERGQPYIEAAITSGLISSDEFGNMDESTLNRTIIQPFKGSIITCKILCRTLPITN